MNIAGRLISYVDVSSPAVNVGELIVKPYELLRKDVVHTQVRRESCLHAMGALLGSSARCVVQCDARWFGGRDGPGQIQARHTAAEARGCADDGEPVVRPHAGCAACGESCDRWDYGSAVEPGYDGRDGDGDADGASFRASLILIRITTSLPWICRSLADRRGLTGRPICRDLSRATSTSSTTWGTRTM